MKYTHDVIHNGIYYRAGEEIPQPETSAKTENETAPAEEKPKKRRTAK